MSVWKSIKKLVIFASLFLLLKSFCLRSNIKHSIPFHHQMNHPEVRQKYSAAHRIFNFLLGVSSGDETLRLMLGI